MTNTPNKGYNNQTTGSNVNTWGIVVNSNFTIIDLNLGGTLPLNVAGSANITLTGTQAQNLIHNLTGLLTGNIQYIFPAVGGMYLVENNTTGAFTITAKVTGGASSVSCPQGASTLVFVDATIPGVSSSSSSSTSALPWAVAGGAADAITAAYVPANSSLTDGLLLGFRAIAANATTTPTFSPDGFTAHVITQMGGAALAAGSIAGAYAEYLVRYNLANTRWEVLNPTVSGVALLSGAQTFTGAQKVNITSLTSSGGSIAIDFSANNDFSHTLTENTTLANPSNLIAGQSGSIFFTQNASSPKTLAYGSNYKFSGGVAPALTATNSALDTLYYNVRSSSIIECNLVKGFA